MKVLNMRDVGSHRDNAVYVGRPTKWGNPFVIGRDGDRATVIEKYRQHLWASPELMASLHELVDMDLVCWCAPEPCHADVLIRAVAWALEQ